MRLALSGPPSVLEPLSRLPSAATAKMHLFPPPTIAAAVFLSLALLLMPSATEAYNITAILAKYKELSTFNHYLSLTHLAADINSRDTITVYAVDDAAMADLLAKHHSIYTVKNILSLHVLLDYYGAKKLHQLTKGTALAATMFQATGSAPGAAGFVNITDLKGEKVRFGPQDNGGALPATFVKAVEEIPYNISIIHVSSVLPAVAGWPAAVSYISAKEQANGAREMTNLPFYFTFIGEPFDGRTSIGKNLIVK